LVQAQQKVGRTRMAFIQKHKHPDLLLRKLVTPAIPQEQGRKPDIGASASIRRRECT